MNTVAAILAIVAVGLLGVALYLMVQNAIQIVKPQETPYDIRRKEFMSNLDTRQYQVMEDLKGASLTEVVATLEKRIYDLEQRLTVHERRSLDDGK